MFNSYLCGGVTFMGRGLLVNDRTSQGTETGALTWGFDCTCSLWKSSNPYGKVQTVTKKALGLTPSAYFI